MTHHTFSVPAIIISRLAKSVVLFIVISLLGTGCHSQAEPPIPPQSQPAPKSAQSQNSTEKKDKNDFNENTDSTPAASWTPAQNRPWTELTSAHDTWEIGFLHGARIGYIHNRIIPFTLPDGQKAVKWVSTSRLKMQRFGQATEIDLTAESTEKPQGELIAFAEVMKNGPTSQVTQARVEGDQLRISKNGTQKSLAWSPEIGGFNAIMHSLLSVPMKPGEHRRLRHLVPMFDSIATADLVAQKIEPVKLLHGTYRLLRINLVSTLADGTQISGAIWTNSNGQPIKTYTKLLEQETYLVSREEALAKYEPGRIDLGFDMLVRPEREEGREERGEEKGKEKRQQAYLVTLEDTDPATVFANGSSQSVKPIDAHTARVTVRAIRPNTETFSFPDPPTMADLNPNAYIDSNDPAVRAMAKEATKDATTDWAKAVAAERYVHDTLKKADYSQVFSTASETAKSKSGDCTEHAVLLAALGRSLGIPSRVVVGLVYSEPLGAFGFHMWTEMYLDDAWIPMDATLGHGGIGTGHLKLGHTTLQNGLADSAFFALPKIIGKLKIKVE